MKAHLTKSYSWNGLTTVQLKRKMENMEIEDVFARSRPLDNWQRPDRINKILKNLVQKVALEFLYLHYTVDTGTPFSQVEHPKFRAVLILPPMPVI